MTPAVLALLIAAVPALASAQAVETTAWTRGTTLGGFIGATSTSSDVDVAAGAGFGWEILPHFGLEGRGTWYRQGPRARAFSATLAARVPLTHARPLAPFVSAGVGMHRASFDAGAERMPEFYRRRLAANGSSLRGETFEDFMATFGGGVDVYISTHLAVRPEIAVGLITTRSDVRAMPVYGVQVTYHFETHPVRQ